VPRSLLIVEDDRDQLDILSDLFRQGGYELIAVRHLTLDGSSGPSRDVVFSPDGHRLTGRGRDGTLKIFDATPLAEKPCPQADQCREPMQNLGGGCGPLLPPPTCSRTSFYTARITDWSRELIRSTSFRSRSENDRVSETEIQHHQLKPFSGITAVGT
jgi:WD40 repeat protein